MKKRFTTPEFKLFNERHSKSSFISKLRFKDYKARANRAKYQKAIIAKKSRDGRKVSRKKSYVYVTAPEIFSIIKNPVGVLRFIQELDDLHIKGRRVFVILREVKEVTYDTIVVLLSIMFSFKSSKIDFNGDFPREEKANEIVRNSGFLGPLFEKSTISTNYNMKTPNTIFRSRKRVDAAFTAGVLDKVAMKLWNKPKRFQGVNRVLIEIMQNTHNHAKIGSQGEKHWWLSINHHKDMNYVSFSFVDYGVGIFKSLDNKPEGNKFYGRVNLLRRRFHFGDNAQLLKLIMDGELHNITSTKKGFHGKGLPGIKQTLTRSQISNLYIISDNVFADIAKEKYFLLDNKFSGTFIHWELNKNNVCCDGSYKDQNI